MKKTKQNENKINKMKEFGINTIFQIKQFNFIIIQIFS